jgi:hypothetical protein
MANRSSKKTVATQKQTQIIAKIPWPSTNGTVVFNLRDNITTASNTPLGGALDETSGEDSAAKGRMGKCQLIGKSRA